MALGLDTSLDQVGSSLARRTPDGVASFDGLLASNPPETLLDTLVADSKPMVWWTLKYKTRWLSDASIVSGNPVFTNFLWNELGRGVDLEELDVWLESPEGVQVLDELTVAVFASEAPRWTDYFPAESIDEDLARAGQDLFAERCASCHGTYDKGWDAPDADTRDAVARRETVGVHYAAQTTRVDVGTDPQRAAGMAVLEALNGLDISAKLDTVVEAAPRGYVPPPLDGIWARYPYFHHNAAPTLCDVLSPPEERVRAFVQGPSNDLDTEFDADCVGYPTGEAIPEAWRDDEGAWVVLEEVGLSLEGHDEMLYDADGSLAIGPDERAALIAFLKTL
jgi:mono/diheme cytochrome c family protein